MVRLAIESSKEFVSRYIVIDKDGSTIPAIKECRDEWDLDIDIYVKPKMNLRESRAFALTLITEPWVLVQDGDEVFHTDGPNDISTLRYFMDRPNIYFVAPMIPLCGDLWLMNPKQPQQIQHSFLYHNNGTLRAPSINMDIPIMDGWKINLVKPYKFNCRIKLPKRMFLRQFWKEWCQDTDAYLRYPDIERYVSEILEVDVETESKEWYKRYIATLIPYKEEKWGYYPKVIRKRARAQQITLR